MTRKISASFRFLNDENSLRFGFSAIILLFSKVEIKIKTNIIIIIIDISYSTNFK